MAEVQKPGPGLESSLTSMDWLHTINIAPGQVGRPSSGKSEVNNNNTSVPIRRSPGSPNESSQDSGAESSGATKDGKPPYSYANLITFAVNSTQRKMMTLSEIYQWITDNFPYFKEAGNGWKVSD